MDACLLIDKPQNMTSFDVCHQLRKITGEKRIGHTGTLDPNATGLLIVLLGKYTKYLPYCDHDRKEYIASFKLGQKTDTLDIWGNVVATKAVISVTAKQWEAVFKSFLGKQKQIPPMVSAIKKDGKRLYELAFAGQEVEREARDIEIYELELLSASETEVSFRAVVSSGTYIRSLCEDMAAKTGNYAMMSALRRTKIQDIKIDQACSLTNCLDHLQDIKIKDILNTNYEKIEVTPQQISDIKNGKRMKLAANTDIVILCFADQILAAYERVENDIYKSKRGLF
ncbi:MAG: tRNA pseudouridine(55) synthase TruB [Erysipelotrichaceae bacterium]|nr:tRNA pseudouridine(55) synthase TruB [Erysipelotrichaceae bacterium]